MLCCDKLDKCDEIKYKIKDWSGPDEDGWCAIKYFCSQDSYVKYVNIYFCPFCGTKL